MFGVLDRYIGRTILYTIMITLFLLVSLSGIIKFVEQLSNVGSGHYTVMVAGLFTLLGVPNDIEVFFPMATLLGALIGLGTLAKRSELVVMQASGFTKMQIVLSVLKTAIPLILVVMVIGEWVAPQGEQSARNLRAHMLYGGSLLSNQAGVWAKDGNSFIYIERIRGHKENIELIGLNVYTFNPQQQLSSVLYASSAVYDQQKKSWTLYQVDESDLQGRSKIESKQLLSSRWQTSLTPDKLNLVVVDVDDFSLSGLYGYIQYLKSTGQDAKTYELSFWKKIFTPLSVMVMLLTAVSCIFGPLRSVPMGVKILTGIVFGFVFFLLNEALGNVGLVYNLPPILCALVPSVVFLVLSIYFIRRRY